MKMPTINIFLYADGPPKKEKKKEEKKDEKKDNLLAKALKKSNDNEDEIISEIKTTNNKLRRMCA